ncbi:MAG TPA: polysaccharide deacetylase family protein, partial [Bryobacteraceae bacterium]|nr:polysaccharide deacetylase family protein [Bryobacteraceae bacterium]
MLIAANYHYVRPRFDSPHPGVFGVTADGFADQIAALGRAGEFVGAAEIRAAAAGVRRLPERAIVITFDDGLREHYEVAWQILRSRSIPAIMFVNTRPIAEQIVCTVHKIHLLRSAMPSSALWQLIESTAQELGIPLDCELDEANMRAQYPFDDETGAKLKYLLNFGLGIADRARLMDACFRTCFGAAEHEVSRNLYLTRQQIRELGSHDAIGTHGHDHVPLALLEHAERENSSGRSVHLLAEWMGGQAPVAIS